ncbi:uncharacterized protein LOC107471660 [Arachis duranensis]|uniref:Uncharacterized protein LOC107471660 n=1 Tax=Arachis duranensis TaxID=130453 RepID=A0A6P4BZE9_ARADU|nr:uncharacterized protein LOC107471660 [Arachis duranensis]
MEQRVEESCTGNRVGRGLQSSFEPHLEHQRFHCSESQGSREQIDVESKDLSSKHVNHEEQLLRLSEEPRGFISRMSEGKDTPQVAEENHWDAGQPSKGLQDHIQVKENKEAQFFDPKTTLDDFQQSVLMVNEQKSRNLHTEVGGTNSSARLTIKEELNLLFGKNEPQLSQQLNEKVQEQTNRRTDTICQNADQLWSYREKPKMKRIVTAGSKTIIQRMANGEEYFVELSEDQHEMEHDSGAMPQQSTVYQWASELAFNLGVHLNLKRKRDLIINLDYGDDMKEAKEICVQQPVWEATFVYGHPDYKKRRDLWKELTFVSSNLVQPRMLIGDFNDAISQDEKVGLHPKPTSQIEAFRNFVYENALFDLELQGMKYTWFSNPRNGCVTKERLDRALVNWEWRRVFEHATLSALPHISSDHCPLVLNVKPRGRRIKNYKFEAYWVDHVDCDTVIRRGWTAAAIGANHWTDLNRKILNCKKELNKWSKATFKRADIEIQNLKFHLKQMQEADFTESRQDQINKLKLEITRLWRQEEKYWGQRSRVKWLKFGDKNTSFFHASTIQRRDRNRIERLKDSAGVWVCGERYILKLAGDHFQNLFKALENLDMAACISHIPVRVTDDMNEQLMEGVTDKEIKEATFSLGSLKAPGPNGLNGIFFQKYWTVVGTESAFVGGRLIQDNLVIVQEMFHALNKKGMNASRNLAIKIDMNKAYDRLEWSFLEAILRAFGFNLYWIELLMKCVRQVSYKIKINGLLSSTIEPQRELRQGDPLSPYLFIIAAEIFTILMDKAREEGRISGVKIAPTAPAISHLLFAYDCIIFSKDSEEEIFQLINILNMYTAASGQRINLDKFGITFGNQISIRSRVDIKEILGLSAWDRPGKYLGLPAHWGRSKNRALSWIEDKVVDKLGGWEQKLLNQSGKEVLIKSIIQAIPAYAMNVVLFPKGFCQCLSKRIAKFWWASSDKERGIHWKSWDKICVSKKDGGIGFKDLYSQNIAHLAKQAWRILDNPNAIWVQVLKAIYYPNKDFKDVKAGKAASWMWKSIIQGRDFLLRNGRWLIGNGSKVRIEEDRWIMNMDKNVIIRNNDIKFVKDLIVEGEGWNMNKLRMYFDGALVDKIIRTPVSLFGREDKFSWPFRSDGMYTIKSGYHVARSEGSLGSNNNPSTSDDFRLLWQEIWKLRVSQKIRTFLWRASHNILPVFGNLFNKRVTNTPLCPICLQEPETIEHALLLCPWTRAAWFGA